MSNRERLFACYSARNTLSAAEVSHCMHDAAMYSLIGVFPHEWPPFIHHVHAALVRRLVRRQHISREPDGSSSSTLCAQPSTNTYVSITTQYSQYHCNTLSYAMQRREIECKSKTHHAKTVGNAIHTQAAIHSSAVSGLQMEEQYF